MMVTMMRMMEVATTTLIITIVGSEEGTAISTIVDSVVVIFVIFSVVGIEFVTVFNVIVVKFLLEELLYDESVVGGGDVVSCDVGGGGVVGGFVGCGVIMVSGGQIEPLA